MEVESSHTGSGVFEPAALCKPVPTSATSTNSNRSIYSDITPGQDKQEEPVDASELVELKGTKEWVRRQLVEHEATLLARQQDVAAENSTTSTQEEVNANILELQSQLQEQSTKLSVQELVLERLQCGDVLSKFLFDPPDSKTTEEVEPSDKEKGKICDMVKKQNELVFELGKCHKDVQDLQENLDEVKKKSFEQQVRNRELMTLVQQRKEKQQGRSQEDSNDRVKMLESKLAQAMSDISRLQHIYQALMVGSQVHWAQDPDLQELMISLGSPPDI